MLLLYGWLKVATAIASPKCYKDHFLLKLIEPTPIYEAFLSPVYAGCEIGGRSYGSRGPSLDIVRSDADCRGFLMKRYWDTRMFNNLL